MEKKNNKWENFGQKITKPYKFNSSKKQNGGILHSL